MSYKSKRNNRIIEFILIQLIGNINNSRRAKLYCPVLSPSNINGIIPGYDIILIFSLDFVITIVVINKKKIKSKLERIFLSSFWFLLFLNFRRNLKSYKYKTTKLKKWSPLCFFNCTLTRMQDPYLLYI